MLRYILRRLAVIPFGLILVHLLGYAYAHLVRPLRAARNPFLAAVSDSTPLWPTYQAYLQKVLQLDFGTMPAPRSLGSGDISILDGISKTASASLGLLGIALGLSILLGIIFGLIAVRVNPARTARWLTSFSTVGLAMPSFYLGSLFFAGWFLYIVWGGPGTTPILPFQGFGWDEHLIMPVLVLMARPLVQISQVTASLMIEELNKQYVQAARAFGSTWRRIRSHNALRNIIAPVIVTIAGALRLLVAELIVVEWLFNWPGLGSLLAQTLIPSSFVTTGSTPEGILFLNPPVVAAVLTVFAALFLLADLVASVLTRSFDPRLRIT